MGPGEMPDGLQPLTQVEEMPIARAHVKFSSVLPPLPIKTEISCY